MKTTLILLVLFVGIMIFSCEDPRDYNQCSTKISDSKENGMFVKDFKVDGEIWKINDTLQVRIKSAWMEKHWRLDKNYKPYAIDGFQMYIETYEEDVKGEELFWSIGTDAYHYFRKASKSCLMSDFQEMPTDSVLIWQVQKGTGLNDDPDKIILGEVSLANY